MPDVLVVDCSVAAKWVLPEPDRDRAIRLLEQHESGEISLIAPDVPQMFDIRPRLRYASPRTGTFLGAAMRPPNHKAPG